MKIIVKYKLIFVILLTVIVLGFGFYLYQQYKKTHTDKYICESQGSISEGIGGIWYHEYKLGRCVLMHTGGGM